MDASGAELRVRDAAIETLTSQVALERRDRRARPPVAPEGEPAIADADAAERQPEVG